MYIKLHKYASHIGNGHTYFSSLQGLTKCQSLADQWHWLYSPGTHTSYFPPPLNRTPTRALWNCGYHWNLSHTRSSRQMSRSYSLECSATLEQICPTLWKASKTAVWLPLLDILPNIPLPVNLETLWNLAKSFLKEIQNYIASTRKPNALGQKKKMCTLYQPDKS